MPTRKVAPSAAPGQAQSTTNPPSETDVQWQRFSDTLARMRGLSSALRIITETKLSGSLSDHLIDNGDDAAYVVATTIEELADATSEIGANMIFSACPRVSDTDVVREARRQGVFRPRH